MKNNSEDIFINVVNNIQTLNTLYKGDYYVKGMICGALRNNISVLVKIPKDILTNISKKS